MIHEQNADLFSSKRNLNINRVNKRETLNIQTMRVKLKNNQKRPEGVFL